MRRGALLLLREALIRVTNLKTYFHAENDESEAVDGVGFHICDGETLDLVGASGCGSSVSTASISRFVPQPTGRAEASVSESR